MTAAVKTHHAVLGVLRVSLAGLGLDKTERRAILSRERRACKEERGRRCARAMDYT
jgi:hypothetical protein